MATIEDLRDAGFAVGLAFELPDRKVFRVEGTGVSVQVGEDDEDAIASLIAGKPEAEQQVGETPAETQLRWHDDPEHDFELPEESVEPLREQARAERRARRAQT